MMNPTGKGIRNDAGGSGYYGAPRRKIKADGTAEIYRHKGTDLECEPGQDVISPLTGIVKRKAIAYSGSKFTGLVIEAKKMTIKMLYLEVDDNLVGKCVKQGEVIGEAQDISERYSTVDPHVHVEILSCDPEIFIQCAPFEDC